MPPLDTRLDWGAIEAVASGQAGTVQADPPDLLAEGKTRLYGLVDTWANLNEAEWAQEAVDRLKNDILDVFQAHPGEAEGWFRAWRQAHPGAKLS